jgi:hypothetical protein
MNRSKVNIRRLRLQAIPSQNYEQFVGNPEGKPGAVHTPRADISAATLFCDPGINIALKPGDHVCMIDRAAFQRSMLTQT